MLKNILSRLREYKKETILTPLLMAIEVAMEVLIPLIISIFGQNLQDGNGAGMLKWGALMIVCAVVSLIAGMLAARLASKAAAGLVKNLRNDMYEKVQGFSFANIDKFSTSSLVTRLTTDLANVQMAFMMVIRTAIRSPLMLIFSIIMSFAISPTLPTIFFITAPILGFGLFFCIFKVMPIFKRVFKKYDGLNNSIQENVKGMRVVKAYVREEYETKKFTAVSDEICQEFTRAEKILAFNSPLMQFCLQGALVAIGLLGSRIVINGTQAGFNVFSLQSLLTYSLQILMSLQMLSMIFVMITMSTESVRRISEVLDENSSLTNPENPITEVLNGDISFNSVSFRYSQKAERFALENINLDIKSGETIGILGGTGSSKTTLISLIPRLYDVTEGVVTVGGVDVRNYDMEVLRNNVAVVLQKNMLFSGTIKDNLRWGNKEATDEEMIEACKLAQADEFIQSFPDKYDTVIDQGGANVSGGQKQRLCIARALLKKPKILILDDSTSAVDMKTDALLRKAFKDFIPDTTKIIIAQRVASVMDADKIVVLNNGKIDAVGSHEELISSNEIYKEVYESQNSSDVEGGEQNG